MTHTILRLPAVLRERGRSRSSHYADIQQGLCTRPVVIGLRAVGWPANEIAALNAARIAGKTDAEIRTLVVTLETARKAAAPDHLGTGILPITIPGQGNVHGATAPVSSARVLSAAHPGAPLGGNGSKLYVPVTRKVSPEIRTQRTSKA